MALTASHRWIAEDGAHHCFACGTWTDDAENRAGPIPCRPGGYDHPPYILFVPDEGAPYVETCAAHPYADQPDPAQWSRP